MTYFLLETRVFGQLKQSYDHRSNLSLCGNALRPHVNSILLLLGVGVNFKPLKRLLVWNLGSAVLDKLKSLGCINFFSSL